MKLSSFCAKERQAALSEVAAKANFPPETKQVNMHLHTFFSYNGEGWSPTQVAVEMKKLGIYSAAICDFDVLEGVDEFFGAADLLGLRAAAGFESRVFFKEYADAEINSPGEPGVFYFMGFGFVGKPEPGSKAEAILDDMLERSHSRNRAVIARINAKLDAFQLDYDEDVLPLTPKGNATERHICVALHEKALRTLGSEAAAAKFWQGVFGCKAEDVVAKIGNANAFTDMLRSKLIKRGGVGYQQPEESTFPALDTVIAMIKSCRAIPMTAWLDGDSAGEAKPAEQLALLKKKGIAAVNIIPDRNWNFKDPEVAAKKIANLDAYVAAAQALDLPINVGTEGNKPGQRLVDDFEAPALKKHHAAFLEGAQVMVGHTRLLRFADLSFTDAKADAMFANTKEKIAFFAAVGALPAPDGATLVKLASQGPKANLDYFKNQIG
ncbi:MAG: hypothetical protein GX561_15385 [Lentisphaerae bacterium]|jgi:hypothetical protein|nr:hypothetical protein [Lentisphaerota bacterium]